MGKAVAYLSIIIFGLLLWSYTGLFDGMFSDGNMEERAKYWATTMAREAPKGTHKGMVDAVIARHGMSLECFNTAATPPVADCIADDPSSKGGSPRHPVALQLRFTFRDEKLERFETGRHILQ